MCLWPFNFYLWNGVLLFQQPLHNHVTTLWQPYEVAARLLQPVWVGKWFSIFQSCLFFPSNIIHAWYNVNLLPSLWIQTIVTLIAMCEEHIAMHTNLYVVIKLHNSIIVQTWNPYCEAGVIKITVAFFLAVNIRINLVFGNRWLIWYQLFLFS